MTEVRGFGAQGGSRERQAGISHSSKIYSRVLIEWSFVQLSTEVV